MNNWQKEMDKALEDFIRVSELAGINLKSDDLIVEYQTSPHRQPTCLPKSKMAIYAFWWNDKWLKIGKVGPNSGPRYTSQHYTGSAMSTLSGSLANDPKMKNVREFNINNPGEWIKKTTCRVNILIPLEKGNHLLSLLETFLHARLKPYYEG